MIRARPYAGDAPAGSIVVRIVRSGERLEGFIREVEEPGDGDSTYPSEQRPIDQVWRLVNNKIRDMPRAAVFVEMEAGIEWDPAWGEITD